jgi:hypothetical protein
MSQEPKDPPDDVSELDDGIHPAGWPGRSQHAAAEPGRRVGKRTGRITPVQQAPQQPDTRSRRPPAASSEWSVPCPSPAPGPCARWPAGRPGARCAPLPPRRWHPPPGRAAQARRGSRQGSGRHTGANRSTGTPARARLSRCTRSCMLSNSASTSTSSSSRNCCCCCLPPISAALDVAVPPPADQAVLLAWLQSRPWAMLNTGHRDFSPACPQATGAPPPPRDAPTALDSAPRVSKQCLRRGARHPCLPSSQRPLARIPPCAAWG